MFLHLSLCVITVCYIYYYITRTFNHWKDKNVKGPKPIPFFGNFKNVALRKQHMGMFYNEIYNQYPEEKVVGFYRMTSPTLLIRDLDLVKQILVKNFELFPERGTNFSERGLGQNIFHSDAETWKILRARITSVFTSSKFKTTFHLLTERGDKLNNYISNVTKEQPEQGVYKLMLKHTVGMTLVVVFGLDVDTINNNRVFEIFDDNLKTTNFNELDMLFPGCLTKWNLSIINEIAIKFSHEIFRTGVQQLQLPPAKSELRNAMDVLLSMRQEGDILMKQVDKMEDKPPFLKITDDLLAAQVWMLYVAGYGNNTLSLTYALYHLAWDPDVQEKLIQEVDTILGKYDGILTYDAFNEMKYLEMVFQETLRMHPLTNAVVRSAAQDTKLEGTDTVIDKGTTIIMSPYGIQHDEKNFPDHKKFNPDRFSPENIKDRHPCAFLSFGAGRRSCLGSRLARILFGVSLVKLLSKFRVETTKNTLTRVKYDPCRLLLSPEQSIQLKFLQRVK